MRLISMGYVVFDQEWSDYGDVYLNIADAKDELTMQNDSDLAVKEIFDGFPIDFVHPAGAYVSP